MESDFYGSEDEGDDIATEVEIRVDNLLKDIALFKRRCADDKTRLMLNSLHDIQAN